MELFVGQLVDSYYQSFGRITHITDMGYIQIYFRYIDQTISYTKEDVLNYMKVYNKDETGYINDVSGFSW